MRIHLSADQHDRLLTYLFADDDLERVAFLYADIAFDRTDAYTRRLDLLDDDDYVRRSRHGAELSDAVRPAVIRTAHDNGYAVVETHAHRWPGARTRFSRTDVAGLDELGPHMLWRLAGIPYTALVFGPDSFDALQWQPGGAVTTIDGLVIEGVLDRPTGLTSHSRTSVRSSA
jgi:hypothetical protein